MKKLHLIMLIVGMVITLFSAYSLASINHVHKISFEAYHGMIDKFENGTETQGFSRLFNEQKPPAMEFVLINNTQGLENLKIKPGVHLPQSLGNDFDEYLLLFCSMGYQRTFHSRMKVMDIAQRDNIVEVKLNIEIHPGEGDHREPQSIGEAYLPYDLVRIHKSKFPEKGKLRFIFKDQRGQWLNEMSVDI